ncbi:MAG: hypothetical protein JXJ19_01520 [Elusimicrobia bacterium]|nr:hypothetical protein [Elusimicrobiota bacterium]
MNKNDYMIDCPCCGAKIWIDKETGGILRSTSPEKDKQDFNGLLAKHRKHEAGLKDAFAKAFAEEQKRKKLIEKKFKNAMENIDELEEPGKPSAED